MKRQKKILKKVKLTIAENAKDGVVTLDSGLQYKLSQKVTVKSLQLLIVVTHEYFNRGAILIHQAQRAISFPNGVIKGWRSSSTYDQSLRGIIHSF